MTLPQPKIPESFTLTFQVASTGLELFAQALGTLPHNAVRGLIDSMTEQVNQQVVAFNATLASVTPPPMASSADTIHGLTAAVKRATGAKRGPKPGSRRKAAAAPADKPVAKRGRKPSAAGASA